MSKASKILMGLVTAIAVCCAIAFIWELSHTPVKAADAPEVETIAVVFVRESGIRVIPNEVAVVGPEHRREIHADSLGTFRVPRAFNKIEADKRPFTLPADSTMASVSFKLP